MVGAPAAVAAASISNVIRRIVRFGRMGGGGGR